MKYLKIIKDKPYPKNKKLKYREAARAIVFDSNNLIPMLFVSKENYHKIPGGGIENGEGVIEACRREMAEETGCEIKVGRKLGCIKEYRSEFNLIQVSHCYIGKVVDKGKPHLEKGELDEGFKLVWFTLDEAIEQFKKDKPQNYEGKFIQERDLTFLLKVKETLNGIKKD